MKSRIFRLKGSLLPSTIGLAWVISRRAPLHRTPLTRPIRILGFVECMMSTTVASIAVANMIEASELRARALPDGGGGGIA